MSALIAGRKGIFVALALLFSVGIMSAASYSYVGDGGLLTVATFDPGTGDVVQGVTTFVISVPDIAIVEPGDSVLLTLMGLEYPYAGDLHVTLSDATNTITGDVFNHIGAFSPGDPGYATQFGNSSSICSGNYSFDSSFGGDIWAAAGPPLGSSDSIPCGNYAPSTAFSGANDNLSFQFAGLPINGNWTLTIYDDYPPTSFFAPQLVSWSLTVQASAIGAVPEPSTFFPICLAAAGLLGIHRRVNYSRKVQRL